MTGSWFCTLYSPNVFAQLLVFLSYHDGLKQYSRHSICAKSRFKWLRFLPTVPMNIEKLGRGREAFAYR